MTGRWTSLVTTLARMAWLTWRGLTSRRPVVGDADAVVSLTSYGKRIGWVHLTIESVAAGAERPARLVLWLDDERALRRPPWALRRLVRRGLEIRETPDWGPHKKYFPAVLEGIDRPLVTCDDDVLYPRQWLGMLMRAHESSPDAVVAHRVNRIRVQDGALLPYAAWGRAADLRETPRNFATGVKGILYPVSFQAVLRRAGTGFLANCRHTDDIWLHHLALRAQVRVLPVLGLPMSAVAPVRGIRSESALADANVGGGRNDRVIEAVYAPDELRAIIEDDWSVLDGADRLERPGARRG